MTNRDDLDDINRLLAEYYVNFDRGEHEAWVDLFAPDGEFLAFGRSFSGHDRLTRLAQSAPTGVHVAGAPLIEVDGEHATVQQGFLFVDAVTREIRIGFYDDALVCADNRWRFRTRRCTFMTPNGPADQP